MWSFMRQTTKKLAQSRKYPSLHNRFTSLVMKQTSYNKIMKTMILAGKQHEAKHTKSLYQFYRTNLLTLVEYDISSEAFSLTSVVK